MMRMMMVESHCENATVLISAALHPSSQKASIRAFASGLSPFCHCARLAESRHHGTVPPRDAVYIRIIAGLYSGVYAVAD